MKIVINAFSARLGGGQTYLLNLLKFIPQRPNLEIILLAPADLKVPEHPAVTRYSPRIRLDNPLVRALWEKIALPKYLSDIQADILFCPGGVVATKAPKGCKVVTMFRNMIPFDPLVLRNIPFGLQRLRNFLLYRIMLRSMKKADLTIFISDYARSVIESLARIPNAVTIPHGVGDSFRTHAEELPVPQLLADAKYLLYVSRFDVYKHHYQVVSAYLGLPDSLKLTYKLVLIGESDLPGAESVHELISRSPWRENIIILGAVPYEGLPAYYHNAQAVIFASSCENCPNILLESLGSGRPVLSSNVMPMPEFGGDAVVYFSPFEPSDITQALVRVLSDEEYAKCLAAKAVLQGDKYQWRTTAEETWSKVFELVDS